MDRKSNHSLSPSYPRRAASAARTRQALVRAAGELFVTIGYSATTVTAIAERAGVGRATVFTSVPGGKPELFKLARDVAIAGDDKPIPMAERPWLREAMAATDPAVLVRLQARNYRMVHQRAARLERSLIAAAAQEPELAELLAVTRHQRATGTALVIGHLVELGAIPSRSRQRYADILYAISSPDVYLQLTEERSWTSARYERWLAGAMELHLLRLGR